MLCPLDGHKVEVLAGSSVQVSRFLFGFLVGPLQARLRQAGRGNWFSTWAMSQNRGAETHRPTFLLFSPQTTLQGVPTLYTWICLTQKSKTPCWYPRGSPKDESPTRLTDFCLGVRPSSGPRTLGSPSACSRSTEMGGFFSRESVAGHRSKRRLAYGPGSKPF